jgi:hypothetical protein
VLLIRSLNALPPLDVFSAVGEPGRRPKPNDTRQCAHRRVGSSMGNKRPKRFFVTIVAPDGLRLRELFGRGRSDKSGHRVDGLITLGLVVLWLAFFVVQAADAACVGKPGNRREFVGAPPDLFFTAGVKATLYIPQVYVNFKDLNESGDTTDCGANAYSKVTGVTVQDTYCFSVNCSSGQSAAVDVANSYLPSEPSEYREPSGIEYLQGPVPVTYDGTAPAGTSGAIDFAMNDEFGNEGKVLARVNVYIVSGKPPSTWFQVASAPSTIRRDSLILNHKLLNGTPSARVFVMHQGAGRPWNHPLAVTYDSALGKWKIRNEDGAAMPAGLFFNVRIDPSALHVYTGRASNTFIIVDDPVANGNPFATLIATPVSSGTRRMNHPFGVSYVHPHWLIITTDGLPMPTTTINKKNGGTAGFFVKIFGASQYADDSRVMDPSGFRNTYRSNGVGTDIIAEGAGRVAGNTKFLRQFCWTLASGAPAIATFNQTPLPPPAPISYNWIEGKYYGVSLSGNAVTVFHEDGTYMSGNTPFNVWTNYRPDCPPQCWKNSAGVTFCG